MKVFGPVRALDVRSLAGPVADIAVAPGTELVREGEPIGTFFVIRHGRALLAREGCGIETLADGDCFGQIDPLETEPQGYEVVTIEPTRLLTFSAFGIANLCDAIPGMRERIVAQLPARTAEIRVLAPRRRTAATSAVA
jgi:CRP-like cAMP-binding protein